MLAVVDTGPLYAAADASDTHHLAARAVLERADLQLVIPALVLAEAGYMIGSRLGANAESAFFAAVAGMDVEAPAPADFTRIGELIDSYADWPLGGVDASIAATAERLGTRTIVTFDRRHFGSLRSASGDAFDLLPSS